MQCSMYALGILTCLLWSANMCRCDTQYGPDPWNHEEHTHPAKFEIDDVPPDLRMTPRRIEIQSDNSVGKIEWFYKRLLAILMKGGKVEMNQDDSVEVNLQLQFCKERWVSLSEYLASNNALSEDIFRRSIGYVEEAIVKPTIKEKIVMAWMDYVQFYVAEYQMYITWCLGCLGSVMTFKYAWDRLSHRHLILFVFFVIYLYEAFISYKEVEQQEYNSFISAINTCRWRFWSSECTIPAPDPLVFIKHMHPLKIGVRLFTMLVSEPMLALNSTVKTMVHGITDDLWYPLDKVVYSILVIVINVLLLIFLIMVLFNFILRIPFNISFLAGLVNIGISGRSHSAEHSDVRHITGTGDRISGANLEKLLNVCAQVAQKPRPKQITPNQNRNQNRTKIRKSASTGRLLELVSDKVTDFSRKINKEYKATNNFRGSGDDGS